MLRGEPGVSSDSNVIIHVMAATAQTRRATCIVYVALCLSCTKCKQSVSSDSEVIVHELEGDVVVWS